MIAAVGNDSIVGTSVADSLYGLGGDDTIIRNSGFDTIDGGGTGNDLLEGVPVMTGFGGALATTQGPGPIAHMAATGPTRSSAASAARPAT